MIALGQFRDTFIIAMDDEGLCIIDQHVAHERVLFERIMEKLTTRIAREPAAADSRRFFSCPPAERSALVVEDGGAGAIRIRGRRVRRRQHQRRRRCRRCWPGERMRDRVAGARRGFRGPRLRPAAGGCVETDRRDHGLSRGRQGTLPADAREDASHPRGAARNGVFDGVPAGRR